MGKRKAVVTGVGAITPLGMTVEESWKNLCSGRSGIKPITHFDPSFLKCRIAGTIPDFDPLKFLDRKLAKRMDRMSQLSVSAALMAVEDARFSVQKVEEYRVGIVGASALGACETFERGCAMTFSGRPQRVSPFFVVNVAANTTAGELAILLGAKGPQYFLQEACAAGTKAIGTAAKLIEWNYADVVIVSAADAGVTPTVMAGLDKTNALADSRWNEEPQSASRPFDRDRSGFVASEGAGALVVEEYAHALNRGAHIYAEVAGFSATCDAHHVTAPDPEGRGAAQCMRLAIADAGLSCEEVEYINAHGTSTPANDVMETKVIKEVFGEYAYRIPVSSNKSMIGHLWGGAGAVEAIFTIKTLNTGIIPPTINLDHPDPLCDLDYVPNTSRRARVRIALKNSFGFGGINASLVLRHEA